MKPKRDSNALVAAVIAGCGVVFIGLVTVLVFILTHLYTLLVDKYGDVTVNVTLFVLVLFCVLWLGAWLALNESDAEEKRRRTTLRDNEKVP